jgi:hypothetical protein
MNLDGDKTVNNGWEELKAKVKASNIPSNYGDMKMSYYAGAYDVVQLLLNNIYGDDIVSRCGQDLLRPIESECEKWFLSFDPERKSQQTTFKA